jgi:microfibrillar-associated protein 1
MDRAKLRELALANRDQRVDKHTSSKDSAPGGDEYILENFKVKPESTPNNQTLPEFVKSSSVNNRIDPMEVVEENEKLKSKEMLAQFLNIKRVTQDEDDDLDNKNNLLSIDDTDYPDDVVEYTEWKVRELKRVQAELVHYQEETSDNTTHKEALEDSPEMKSKYRFLQKYYHKGAFYTDDPILRKRDYSEAVEADRVDRDTLPAVMQVKNFGKKGRTKWTHLTNEDTTAFDYGWGSKKNYDEKIVSKMAGSKQSNIHNGN